MDKKASGPSFSIVSPNLFFGKGLGEDSNIPTYGFTVHSSLPYLQSCVPDIGLAVPFNRMIPLAAFAFQTPLEGADAGKTTEHHWARRFMEVGVQAIIPMSDRTVKNVGVPALVHFCLDDLAPVGLRATVPIGSAPPRRLRTLTTLRDASRPPQVPVDIRERTRSIGSSVPRLSGDDVAGPLRRPGVWVWRYGCRNQSTEPQSGDSWSHGAQPSSWRFSPSRNIARTIYRARSACLSAA